MKNVFRILIVSIMLILISSLAFASQDYVYIGESESSGSGLTGFIMIIIGLLIAIFPRGAWFLEIGWKLKDSEPRDGVLILNRVIGIIICIIGLFYFFSKVMNIL